jgi:hypothetical protein
LEKLISEELECPVEARVNIVKDEVLRDLELLVTLLNAPSVPLVFEAAVLASSPIIVKDDSCSSDMGEFSIKVRSRDLRLHVSDILHREDLVPFKLCGYYVFGPECIRTILLINIKACPMRLQPKISVVEIRRQVEEHTLETRPD